MPTQINGTVNNVIPASSVGISGATNATPIVVTTGAAHNLTEGDMVIVAGVKGNTAANGRWYAHVLSSTTLALQFPAYSGGAPTNSVGSGAYTSGGQLLRDAILPTFQAPSAGDTETAASVGVSLQALADRSAYTVGRTGSHSIVGRQSYGPAAVTEPAGNLTTWAQLTYAAGAYHLGTNLSAFLIPGDVVVVSGALAFNYAGAGSPFAKLQRSIDGGATISDFTGAVHYMANGQYLQAVSAFEVIQAGTSTTQWDLYVIARSSDGALVALLDNATIQITAYRSTV